MHSQRRLLSEILSEENALDALYEERRAANGARRVKLDKLLDDPQGAARAFVASMKEPDFGLGPLVVFDRMEGKKLRHIEAPNVMDAVRIRMIARLVENQIIYRRMIPRSYCPVRGRGGLKLAFDAWHTIRRLLYRNKVWMKSHRGKRYVYFVKTDIRQFFPSLTKELALKSVAKYVHNPDVLDLIGRLTGEHVTIGSGLSAPLANSVLIDIDWKMTGIKGVEGYFRYMDDVLWLFTSKPKAKAILAEYERAVGELGLRIKPWKIERITSAPVTIGGYKIRPNGIRPSKKIGKHLNRLLAKVERVGVDGLTRKECAAIASLNGYVSRTHSAGYRRRFRRLDVRMAFSRVGDNKEVMK